MWARYTKSFKKIIFEKPQNLQTMYKVINVLPPSNLQYLIAAIFFVTDCKELKFAQTALIDKLF